MRAHDSTQRRANVVAVFDSQEDADEAVLELRLAGFKDSRIGYFSRTPDGEMTDLLERNHWMTGAALGAIAGAALGVWLARLIPGWESRYLRGIDTFGLTITCAVFGVLFVGVVGGLIGLAIPRRMVEAPELGHSAGPLVLAVDAGDARDRAAFALSRHGGQVARSDGVAEPNYAGPHPTVHPA
jgi:hypothetical protein